MREKQFRDRSSSRSSLSLGPRSEGTAEEVPLVASTSYRKASWSSICLHLLVFFLYTFAIFAACSWWKSEQDCHAKLVFTPAREALRFKKVTYDGDFYKTSSFRGSPRPELDQAWDDLFEHMNIRLSEKERAKLDQRDVIKLADGSGYYGQVNAYHHLHCLNFIRQAMHPEYYKELAEEPSTPEHVDHCLDDIRQALMCHPDTSIFTFHWRHDDWRRPIPNFKMDHECVDWDALDRWASQRSFSIFDQKSIVHPELGLSFPLVNGSIENVPAGPDMHIVWPEG